MKSTIMLNGVSLNDDFIIEDEIFESEKGVYKYWTCTIKDKPIKSWIYDNQFVHVDTTKNADFDREHRTINGGFIRGVVFLNFAVDDFGNVSNELTNEEIIKSIKNDLFNGYKPKINIQSEFEGTILDNPFEIGYNDYEDWFSNINHNNIMIKTKNKSTSNTIILYAEMDASDIVYSINYYSDINNYNDEYLDEIE